jgi:hypothetical protein
MATYSNNTTIKINGSVSYSITGLFQTSGTIFTGSANKYAVCNLWINAYTSGTITVKVGGRIVYAHNSGSQYTATIYAGEGQSITWESTNFVGADQLQCSGVVFQNTP